MCPSDSPDHPGSIFYHLVDTLFFDWPNSLDCTDLNECVARHDTKLCRLCYKQTNKQTTKEANKQTNKT